MVMKRRAGHSLAVMMGVGLLISLTGCDYWPPALQAQVEQLRSETQTLTMEKTQLQNQLNDLSKAKLDLQAQIDDLGRMNREKSGMINSLQTQLDTLRAKAVRAMAPKAPAKSTQKAPAKPAVKQAAKKKSTMKKM
jgi:chromosome segregation ATPase